MNSVAEAVNTLISAANVAHEKGAYSLEESHYIYLAISFLKKVSNQEEPTSAAPSHGEAPMSENARQVMPEDVQQDFEEDQEPNHGQPSSY